MYHSVMNFYANSSHSNHHKLPINANFFLETEIEYVRAFKRNKYLDHSVKS